MITGNSSIMLFFSLTVLIDVTIVSAHLILPNISGANQHLEHCIKNIYDEHFKDDDPLIVGLSEDLAGTYKHIGPKMILQPYSELISFNLRKIGAYVISTTEAECLAVIKYLARIYNWNPGTKFVIVYEGNMVVLFKVLLKYFVFNVAVLVQSSEEVAIFTYFPYSSAFNDKCRAALLGKCTQGGSLKSTVLYPTKLPNEWTSMTVKVALVELPPFVYCANCATKSGIEIEALSLLSSLLGFGINYSNNYKAWGLILPNGSYTHVYGSLQNKEADIGIGSFLNNYTEIWDFDMSVPYLDDSGAWVVPAPKILSRWKNITSIFNLTLLVAIATILLLESLIVHAISKILAEDTNFKTFANCAITFYSGLLNISAPSCPQTYVLRYIFITYYLYALIIAVAFQSHLTTSLSHDNYEKPLETVQDIIDSRIAFGINPQFKYLFSTSKDKGDIYLYKNCEMCEIGTTCLNRTAFQGNYATMKSRRFLNIVAPTYLDPNGMPTIHTLSSRIMLNLVSMVFTKGHPMFPKINRLIGIINESGFLEHFSEMILFTNKLKFRWRSGSSALKSKTLHLDDLEGVFVLLVAGWLLSMLVLVAEILAKRYHHNIHLNKD